MRRSPFFIGSRTSYGYKDDIVNKYVVPFCAPPDAVGEEAVETARKMAGDIVSA